MTDVFQLEIVTPDRLVVKEDAEEIQIPGKQGYLGVMPGHAPLITELDVGEITYRSHGHSEHLAVAWGFAEVLPEKVTILAETAERPEEIDVARAEESKRRAEDRLKSGNTEIDVARALKALRRADVRLQVAGKALVPAQK
ncbi:MAG: F0F1 ATP synthase subunit epsilon [Terriglobales bacterium]|jgi:F-type H+-transporting ATPase subunit epsilon